MQSRPNGTSCPLCHLTYEEVDPSLFCREWILEKTLQGSIHFHALPTLPERASINVKYSHASNNVSHHQLFMSSTWIPQVETPSICALYCIEVTLQKYLRVKCGSTFASKEDHFITLFCGSIGNINDLLRTLECHLFLPICPYLGWFPWNWIRKNGNQHPQIWPLETLIWITITNIMQNMYNVACYIHMICLTSRFALCVLYMFIGR